MNELNKLYKAILGSFGALVKPNYQIFIKVSEHEIEVKVDDMPLYLPVSDLLASTDSMNKVYFHPACENVISQETEVFKIIRRMAGIRMLELFKKYPPVLQTIAKGAEKRSWNQNTLDILEPFKTVKKQTMTEISEFMARMQVEMGENGIDNRFIHMKVSKGSGRSSTGSGQRVYHRTKPVFPIYNEVVKRLAQSEGQSDNQSIEFHGYSISRAALKLIAHLHRCVVPAVMNPDDIESESTSPVASRLTSFLGCYEAIADQFNRLQNVFRADFDKLGIYPIDLSWTEEMERLPEIYNQVPDMQYNTHNTQEEAVHKQNHLNGMGNMFSVNSTPQSNVAAQVGVAGQAAQLLAQVAAQAGPQNVDGYSVSPPAGMEPNDQWIRVEIDYANNRVVHHAINKLTQMPVVYICTRMGTVMQRTESSGVAGIAPGIGGVGLGGLGGLGGLLGGLNPLAAAGLGGGNNNLAMLAQSGLLGSLTPLQQLALLQGGQLGNTTPASSSSSGVYVDHNGHNISSPTY